MRDARLQSGDGPRLGASFSLDGPDGCGKSSQATELAAWLEFVPISTKSELFISSPLLNIFYLNIIIKSFAL